MGVASLPLVELGEGRGVISLQGFVEQDGLPAGFTRGRAFEQIDGIGGQAHFVGPFFCGQVDQPHQIGLSDAPVGGVPIVYESHITESVPSFQKREKLRQFQGLTLGSTLTGTVVAVIL